VLESFSNSYTSRQIVKGSIECVVELGSLEDKKNVFEVYSKGSKIIKIIEN